MTSTFGIRGLVSRGFRDGGLRAIFMVSLCVRVFPKKFMLVVQQRSCVLNFSRQKFYYMYVHETRTSNTLLNFFVTNLRRIVNSNWQVGLPKYLQKTRPTLSHLQPDEPECPTPDPLWFGETLVVARLLGSGCVRPTLSLPQSDCKTGHNSQFVACPIWLYYRWWYPVEGKTLFSSFLQLL